MDMDRITNPNIIDILSRRLPEDLVYDILFIRLTVKDLLRLKSVCKSWLSLISNPDFIKTHLSKLTNDDPHLTRHHLLISRKIDEDLHVVFEGHSLNSLLNEPLTDDTMQLDYPDDVERVVGCCNGMVCLLCNIFDKIYVALWNPSTGKSKTLPRPRMIFENACTRYGFCYDESCDEYKVFVIFGCRPYEYKVSVYSSKSDYWRIIEDFPFAEVLSEGNYVNGAMYWVVGTSDVKFNHQKSEIIVSLDIKTDTYREILQPNYGEGAYDWSLGTFGKSLSIVCKFETRADLWAMKEYGTDKFWTKLFTIPYTGTLTRSSHLKPICISVNGDLVLSFDSTIVLYNSKDNKYKGQLHNFYGDTLDVHTYVESLVSLPR